MDDILNLSRLDEGEVPLKWEAINLLALAEDVAARLKSTAKKNGVVLTVSGERTEISGVRSIVDEMVYNLCDNAVKYNRKNGRISIAVQKTAEGVSLTVVDKSHSKEIGGTGLGLSIVKHGAAYHNARVTLESTEGVGTAVTLIFPNIPT